MKQTVRLTAHLPRPLLCSLVFLSSLALHCCAPQGYYYNGYNPYRASSYSRALAAENQRNSYYNNNYNYNSNPYSSPSKAPRTDNKRAQSPERKIAGQNRISKADAENAKFAGASNLEDEAESSRTLLLKKKLLKKKLLNKRQSLRPFNSRRCYPYGRSAQQATATPAPREQGRFLWDIGVYNVYPGGGFQPPPLYDCNGGASDYYGAGGGYGGFGGFGGDGLAGLAGGLLSDPVQPAYTALSPFNNFLNLFAPGILQNALAVTVRPRPPPPPPPASTQSDSTGAANDELDDLQSDPEVDPTYTPPIIPQRRPNRVYFDSAGAAPITPAQLVGGVATTVNGIIQQLTGNVQPVYQSSYRRAVSYG